MFKSPKSKLAFEAKLPLTCDCLENKKFKKKLYNVKFEVTKKETTVPTEVSGQASCTLGRANALRGCISFDSNSGGDCGFSPLAWASPVLIQLPRLIRIGTQKMKEGEKDL